MLSKSRTGTQPNVNMGISPDFGHKKADLDQDLLLVNVVYGLVDHTTDGIKV